MKLSCSVVRDLLPLYAEGLVSEETASLVGEHLKECDECSACLEALRQPETPVPEDTAPIRNLKKELTLRRWRAAAAVALCVFLVLFALIAYATDKRPVRYEEGLLSIAGPVEENGKESLLILRDPRVTGSETDLVTDEETGETTLYIQYYHERPFLGNGKDVITVSGPEGITVRLDGTQGNVIHMTGTDEKEMTEAVLISRDLVSPVPDRVIYGFEGEQTLLWGKPMNGGVEILPRLVLGYYVLIAAFLSAVLTVAWIVLRRTKAGPVILQILFAPLSYLLGHLAVKGVETLSLFSGRDFLMILTEAAAFYALLTLCRLILRDRRKETA